MNRISEAFAKGYRQQDDKVIARALKKQHGADNIVVQATGKAMRDRLLARGWNLNFQDVSDRGAWVRIFFMTKAANEVEQDLH